jgi:hypothetical protein
MFSRTILSAVALQTLISAAFAGQAIINNNCGYDVTVLSTASNNQATIGAGSSFSEPLNGHASLKIAKDPSGLWAHGITQFEYSVADTLWYDISLIDCTNGQDASNCPGHEGGLSLTASGGDCASANCAPGDYCPKQAYFVWNDDLATKSCQPGQTSGDITMTLCSGGGRKEKRGIAGRIQY